MISIIIPIFNAENHLRRCVNSILSLQFRDYELILVDDGSNDSSAAICDEYAQIAARIKVIHMQNAGAAAARNAGLDIAQGDYILFCDADDCYDPVQMDHFLTHALDGASPDTLFCFDFRNVWPDGADNTARYREKMVSFICARDKVDFLSSALSHKTAGFSLCNKLYSREIIDRYHIRMFERDTLGNKDDWAEDLMFNLQYLSCIDNVVSTGDAAYMLTKHVSRESESEAVLAGRTEHMLRLFAAVKDTAIFTSGTEFKEEFWKIVIWHIRRFFYADASEKGVQTMRKTYNTSQYGNVLSEWIETALKKWDLIADRWNQREGMDFRYLLEYIVNGNLIEYKVKNYWLWKIYPVIQRVARRKNERL